MSKAISLKAGDGLTAIRNNGIGVDFDNIATDDLRQFAHNAGMERCEAMTRDELIQAFAHAPMPLGWWMMQLQTIFGRVD